MLGPARLKQEAKSRGEFWKADRRGKGEDVKKVDIMKWTTTTKKKKKNEFGRPRRKETREWQRNGKKRAIADLQFKAINHNYKLTLEKSKDATILNNNASI